ncbi:hypothetical protein BDP27DRAFT_1269468 [Rhodocollybia butyracea]|uniref:Fumarylacetoacetase-like C-terminal domain-containing protein n=1 Tax=Rhodocollybia butyracea TaxID=206335 RepID=A0A9P5PL99_9AGAR|nr:hypothetical protein BDP27DRAFT_1269468 [Rhodocollybia butyracea]
MSSIAENFIKDGKKIIAIGRNYEAHIKELGSASNDEPWFFLKPTTSYLRNGGTILIPKGVTTHHEIELGVVIGKEGKDIPRDKWEEYVAGYALGIDMTARNFQQYVKAKSLPWTTSKGFDTFCPISEFVPKEKIKNPNNVVIWIKVNGEDRQRTNTSEMIYDVPELVRHCSSIMTLQEGDLILTGTPVGAVGLICHGDKISTGLETTEGELLATWEGDAANRVGGYAFTQKS